MSETEPSLPVVLVGGWGLPVAMVEPLMAGWPGPVQSVALDDHLLAHADTVTEAAQHLLLQAPRRALWLGWSLGGQIAVAAANQAPERVAGVITLCSNPCFVARPDWPGGLSPEIFQDFSEGLAADARRQWRRFVMLQVRGDGDEPEARRALKPWLDQGPQVAGSHLQASLAWLSLDARVDWAALARPALHLFGEKDQLVNVAVADHLASGVLNHTVSACQVIPGMAHWPSGPALAACRQRIDGFAGGLVS